MYGFCENVRLFSVSSADVLQPFFFSQLRKWKATSQNPCTKPKTKNIGFHQKITEDRGQRCETRTCQIHVITKFLSLSQDYFSLRGHADKPLSWKPADKVGQSRTNTLSSKSIYVNQSWFWIYTNSTALSHSITEQTSWKHAFHTESVCFSLKSKNAQNSMVFKKHKSVVSRM